MVHRNPEFAETDRRTHPSVDYSSRVQYGTDQVREDTNEHAIYITLGIIQLMEGMTGRSFGNFLNMKGGREALVRELEEIIASEFPDGNSIGAEMALRLLQARVSDTVVQCLGRALVKASESNGEVVVTQDEVDRLFAELFNQALAERGERFQKLFFGQKSDAA